MYSRFDPLPFSTADHTVILASSTSGILEACSAAIYAAGYSLVVCENASEVIASMTDVSPTILVIDERLDEIDGCSLIQQLYAIPRFRRFPFIFLTRKNSGWPMWATERMVYGACCFLTIPFNLEELQWYISRCIIGILNSEFPAEEKDFPFPAHANKRPTAPTRSETS